MPCTFEGHNLVALLVNCGGLLSSLLGIVSLMNIRSIETSLRGILLSFSIANIFGAAFFTHDCITYACQRHMHPLSYILVMTIVLSLSHLLLLILHYYIVLTSGTKRKARDFSGVMVTAWLVSQMLANMNMGGSHDQSQAIMIVVLLAFLLVMAFAVSMFFVILRKHRYQESVHNRYVDTFLYTDGKKCEGLGPGQWNITFLGIILFTYVLSSAPWLTNETLGGHGGGYLVHSISTSVYAINYYVPSLVFSYMWYKEHSFLWKKGTPLEKAPSFPLEQNYRLRTSRYFPSSVDILQYNVAFSMTTNVTIE